MELNYNDYWGLAHSVSNVQIPQLLENIDIKANFNQFATKSYVPVLKTGFIWKKGGKGGGRRNWKKRWFELRSHALAYYTDRSVCIFFFR